MCTSLKLRISLDYSVISSVFWLHRSETSFFSFLFSYDYLNNYQGCNKSPKFFPRNGCYSFPNIFSWLWIKRGNTFHLLYSFLLCEIWKTSSIIEIWICKFFNQSLQYCYRFLEAILTHFISSSCAPIYEIVCLLLEKGCWKLKIDSYL